MISSKLSSAISSAFLERSPRLFIAAVVGLILLAGLVSLPVTDRDEARFAQASKQMVESGEVLDIRFQEEPRYKKPAGIYWLQAGSAWLMTSLGLAELNDIWIYRLPSFLTFLVAILLFYQKAAALLGHEKDRLYVSLMLGTALIAVVEGHLAKTDASLFLCAVAVQCALYQGYLSFHRGGQFRQDLWWLLWGGLAAATLLKGPILPIFVATALLTVRYWFKVKGFFVWLRPGLGIALVLAVFMPWFFAIQTLSEGTFVEESLGHDFLGKLLSGQESHGAPPGYYLLLSPVLLWPGAFFVLLYAPYWLRRHWQPHTFQQILLAFLVPNWILLELTPTKLPHYILPLVPAVLLLTASVWHQARDGVPRWWRGVVYGLWSLVTFLLLGALVGWSTLVEYAGQVTVVLTALLALCGLLFWVRWRRLGSPKCLSLFAIAALVYVGVFQYALPSMQVGFISTQVSELLVTRQPYRLASIAYSEPSLVFLHGTDTVFLGAEDLAAFAVESTEAGQSAFVLVPSQYTPILEGAAQVQGVVVEEIESGRGFNYSKGDWTEYRIYDVAVP